MKFLARIWTSKDTSYTMDIFLEDKGESLKESLVQHAAITNEIERNKRIIKIEFFQSVPSGVWIKP